MDSCIFCKMAMGEAPSHKVWEDEKHLGFLTIFPNTEGFSVVITKEHNPSYIFSNSDETITGIVHAAKEVARKLDAYFDDVGRTGMMFEGFGVDHLHAKLFPMHGTKTDEWRQHKSSVDKYFTRYEGYMSSHDYARADDAALAALAEKIRNA
jgi:histidine triad (HIT) family protein